MNIFFQSNNGIFPIFFTYLHIKFACGMSNQKLGISKNTFFFKNRDATKYCV
jgi:hypothetical protein